MEKKLLVIATFCSLVMASCTNEVPELSKSDPDVKNESNMMKIPLSDALRNADAIMQDIEQGTRAINRRVQSVSYATTATTRSGETDTTMYLVNYADNAGFALLAADKRMPEVLAISDSGELNFRDSVENKALADFFRNADEIAKISIENRRDTIAELNPDFDFGNIMELNTPRIIFATDLLLTDAVRKWDKDSPYNKYLPLKKDGEKSCVGCCAIAAGQVCSYFEMPKQIDGLTLDWQGIKTGDNLDHTARLLAYICAPEQLNLDLETYAAYPVDIPPLFRRFGINCSGFTYNFSVETIVSNIDKAVENINGGGITLVSGKYTDRSGLGHIWSVDGYAHYKTGKLYNATAEVETLLHCSWGWNQGTDGYYLWYDDNWIERTLDRSNMPTWYCNYNGMLKMLTGMTL